MSTPALTSRNYVFTVLKEYEDQPMYDEDLMAYLIISTYKSTPAIPYNHIHGFVKFKIPVSVKVVRMLFPGAAISKALYLSEMHIKYCARGTYYEFGYHIDSTQEYLAKCVLERQALEKENRPEIEDAT